MGSRFTTGDAVQTPFGKGVVLEVRNSGRLLIGLQGRSLVVEEHAVTALRPPAARAAPGRRRADRRDGTPLAFSHRHTEPAGTVREIDLHGLTVTEALERVEQALDRALLADVAELRIIHGRSGGRIRAALHRRLETIPSVRAFRIDPRNAGVTLVTL